MNIAYFSHYFTPEIGAPSARLHDFSQQWIAAGQNVQVVTCFPNHPQGLLYPGYSRGVRLRETIDGVDVLRHWSYITPNSGFLRKSLGHLSYWPSAMLLSAPRLAQTNITIGSSPTLFAAIAAAEASWRRRIPFVMEVRDLWPAIIVELEVLRNPQIIRAIELLELALYRGATRIVTVTEAFRRNLLARGVPADKVVTIPNGADTDFWTPDVVPTTLRVRLGLEGKFVALYIGAHGISQGLRHILASAARLRERSDIVILFVGEGAEKAALQEQARREGLTNVRFSGQVDQAGVREYYQLADACLVPLRDIPLFDTFIPSKIFEILSMGKPIIGSVRGEAAEILHRSGAAIVTAPEDSEAIANAIRALADDRERAAAQGRRGREIVLAQFTRRSLAANYLDVLQDAIVEFGQARRGSRR